MRILWHSTAPWGPSSYSVLTARTVPAITRLGHDMAISTWYGLQGAPQRWNVKAVDANGQKTTEAYTQVMVLPCINGADYGTSTLLGTYQMLKAEALITCMDIWVLPPPLTSQMPFVPWTPIDHDPVPGPVLASIKPAIYPMTMSKWGRDILANAGVEAKYIPCSADANLFKPADRMAARQALGVDPACDFLVSMVTANKDPHDRKGIAPGIAGFAKFAKNHPNARLYVHTNWEGPVNVANLTRDRGVQAQTMRPEPLPYVMGMYKDDWMVNIYSASDVLLNTAMSEGFGLPMLEAQMCGCPVIATDFSTPREIVTKGWFVRGEPYWSIGADSWRVYPSIDQIADALEDAYKVKNKDKMRRDARKGVMRYDTDVVPEEHWRPALRDIEKLVCGKGQVQLVKF